MRYEYAKDLRAAVKPGTRHWVCALRLNPALTRYVRNLAPTYVEACATRDAAAETAARARGSGTAAVVPVLPDGTLDWKRASGVSDLEWYDNDLQCVSRYNGLISEWSRKMDARIADIEARRTDMKSREAEYEVREE